MASLGHESRIESDATNDDIANADASINPRPRSRGQQAMASLGHEHRIESDATNDVTANACASSRTPLRDDIAERAGDDIAGSSNLTHTPIPDDKSNTTPR